MPDPFRFKKFAVTQDRAAMKVGTDGVLLGAWSALRDSDRRALDIGTGTGLIALMLAQRCEHTPLHIDAVEIDEGACLDAARNVSASPWPGRVKVIPDSLQAHLSATREKYDVIVCNPPFFVDSLPAPDTSRTLARHAVALPYDELLSSAAALLSEAGRFSVIIPCLQEESFLKMASFRGLSVSRLTRVYPKPNVPPKRSLIELVHADNTLCPVMDSLIIELTGRHCYSSEYVALTSDFYLKF